MPIQKSKVTIFDVAKASGVSSSAVSYALNGKSGVSDVTRDKVLKVAHELGWKPNGAAQALAKAKTQRVLSRNSYRRSTFPHVKWRFVQGQVGLSYMVLLADYLI